MLIHIRSLSKARRGGGHGLRPSKREHPTSGLFGSVLVVEQWARYQTKTQHTLDYIVGILVTLVVLNLAWDTHNMQQLVFLSRKMLFFMPQSVPKFSFSSVLGGL